MWSCGELRKDLCCLNNNEEFIPSMDRDFSVYHVSKEVLWFSDGSDTDKVDRRVKLTTQFYLTASLGAGLIFTRFQLRWLLRQRQVSTCFYFPSSKFTSAKLHLTHTNQSFFFFKVEVFQAVSSTEILQALLVFPFLSQLYLSGSWLCNTAGISGEVIWHMVH